MAWSVISLLILMLWAGPAAAAAARDAPPAPPPSQSLADVLSRDPSPPATGVWPLRPVPPVVHGFDPPEEDWGAGHRGVDLAGRVGQPVRSALAGTVTFVGLIAGKGVVVVDHGSTRTTYEPVSSPLRPGERVGAGGLLGILAPASSHCAPATCLHWGWIRNSDDAYLDPLQLVGAGPVRLLPLWRDQPVG